MWQPHVVQSVLRQLGRAPSQSLGQNFLVDRNVLNRILQIASLRSCDHVLEIGAGLGVLTRALSAVTERVTAIEIDSAMASASRDATADRPNVRILQQDIRETELISVFRGVPRDQCHVVANLPYNISKVILRKFIVERRAIRSVTVMLQKEVAERMVARPATPAYGLIAVAYGLFGEPEIACSVSRNCFYPKPGVDSAVVRTNLSVHPRFSITDEDFFFRVVRAGFSQRRKTLLNSMQANLDVLHPRAGVRSADCSLTRDGLRERILNAGIDPERRAETLTTEEFATLTHHILRSGQGPT
ncbi:MAG: ribosomal RNA small subunit methyltransferase A [Armatimonadetes bacterium CG2_30_59_28]|nr:MAG: ribosomal RNA small subunit methyltransferase A [Armatimonadetes bacterium CG2_30_59_28]